MDIPQTLPQAQPTSLRVHGVWWTERAITFGWFLASLVAILVSWEVLIRSGHASKLLPSPMAVAVAAVAALTHPFHVSGQNDRGIGIHLLASLGRVALGFSLAAIVAIPMGIAFGLSRRISDVMDPYVQLLRPVSPLAWLPIGLALFRSSQITAIFVIAISSLWPILLNTMYGVRDIDPTYLNVARSLGASRLRTLTYVILPAIAPSIVTGLRIGIGIAWLVIVAAEMLVGGTGIGYYVWNEWNNLSIPNIVTAILIIGIVGLLLDRLFGWLHAKTAYAE